MNDQKPATLWYKKPWGIALIVILGIMVLGAVSGGKKEPSKIETATVATPAPVDPAVLEAEKKQLADLKTKFNYKYDQFESKGWYDAKTEATDYTYNKEMLKVNVNNVGYAYLQDQYYGDDWIFHTRVQVKIGDAVYTSADIPSYDPNNSTNNGSGSVWETISYTGGQDNGIIKAIAESGTTPVLVRFAGGSGGVYDFTLSERDRQAIKDAYQLSTLIKETGDTGATK